jgi:pantoate--beta-alanine ligase
MYWGKFRTFSTKPVIVDTIKGYKKLRHDWYKQGKTVGFVPTMGALHSGHTSLANLARKQCDIVVASIFVNPAQFAPTEDLSKYPRTFEDDVKLLQSENVDVVFAPSVKEMYPAGIPLVVTEQVGSFVTVQGKSHQMEGSIRPHFFRGVATVVSKLFNIIEPTTAYFGQKDVQQCSVVKTMVRDLHFPIKIEVGETIRESDGLAKSSRNRYLNEEERDLAPCLYAGFKETLKLFESGERDRDRLLKVCKDKITQRGGVIEYISLADPLGLEEVTTISHGVILSGAIKVGKTRIIDNVLLGMSRSDL